MDSEDETMPPQMDDRTPLQVIEDEGTKAAHDLAHTIVRETVNNNGRVDLARLDRVGPTVRTEVLKLLAKTAASLQSAPATAPQKTRQTGTPKAQKSAAAPVKTRPASSTPVAAPSARRATKEWRDRCCDARGFRTVAYRYGLIVSTAIGLASMALLLFLNR